MDNFKYEQKNFGNIVFLQQIISLVNNNVYNHITNNKDCTMDLKEYYNYLNCADRDTIYKSYLDDWFDLLKEYLKSKNIMNDKICEFTFVKSIKSKKRSGGILQYDKSGQYMLQKGGEKDLNCSSLIKEYLIDFQTSNSFDKIKYKSKSKRILPINVSKKGGMSINNIIKSTKRYIKLSKKHNIKKHNVSRRNVQK
jgi:hypothetical protein